MTYFNDLPLPDITVRAGDTDLQDFTLTQADGITPINLTGKIVELRMRPFRGTQTVQTYRSDGTGPRLTIISPLLGRVRFSPLSTTFTTDAERYRAYFAIYESGTPTANPKTVPQERPLWFEVETNI